METVEPGIVKVHQRACPRRHDHAARCRCTPSYRAKVYDPSAKTTRSATFPLLAPARAWRQDTQRGVRSRQVSAGQALTLKQAADELLAEMRAGTFRSRNRRPYEASTIETYEDALENHLLPGLGEDTRLDAIDQFDLQEWLDELATRVSGRTTRNALMPLQVIFKHQLRRHRRRLVNPTLGLDLPDPASKERFWVEIDQALELLAAVPSADRAAWGLMLLAGLRLGEMQALAWEEVDMRPPGHITISFAWCKRSNQRKPRTKNAKSRTVTMPQELRPMLAEHKLATGGSTGLVVCEADGSVLSRDKLVRRARKAWKSAGLVDKLGPHGARHSYVSAAIAGDVSLFKAQGAAGHSAISTTADIYGHRYRRDADDVASAIDALIARQKDAAES